MFTQNIITASNKKFLVFRVLLLFLHGFAMHKEHHFSNHNFVSPTESPHLVPSIMQSMTGTLTFDGHLSFENIDHAAKDFGNRYHLMPSAVLYPKSVSDISSVIKYIFCMDKSSQVTVAARGHGHSLEGQAQACGGVVIDMESLRVPEMSFHIGKCPYVDVSAGQLWISILHASLEKGLAPKSWTDYLHLTVGGTLSNAGISGQAFRYGPQINNVYQLEVVTGRGEVVTCSEKNNTDLFHAVLGGLGQFGIITKARIALEPAPKMVLSIKVTHYSSQEEWKAHFGIHWEAFFRRKMTYDPLAILAPGQGIFRRAYSFDQQQPG